MVLGRNSQDKIGTSNYYWSFPSQGLIVRRRKQEAFEASIANRKRRRDEVEGQQNALEAERAGASSVAGRFCVLPFTDCGA